MYASSESNSLKIAKIDSLLEVCKSKVRSNLNEGLECFGIAEKRLNTMKLEELSQAEKISMSRCYYNRAYYCQWNNVFLKKSISDLKKRIELIKDIPSKSLANSYYLLANIYLKIGDYEMAENSYLLAIDIFEKLNKKNKEYILKCNLAILHLEKKAFKKALKILNDNFPQIEDTLIRYQYLNTFGRVSKESGDYVAAVNYYQQSLMYIKDTFDIALVKNNLGVSLKRLKRYNDAIDELDESYYLNRKYYDENYKVEYAYYFNNKGDIFQELNQLDSALVYHNLAIIHCLEDSTWNAQNIFKNPDEEQLKLCEIKPDLLVYLASKAHTAYLNYKASNNQQFLDLTLNTYDIYDKLLKSMLKEYIIDESKLNWIENSRKIYADAIHVCVEIDNLKKALSYLNSSKAVLLNEQLTKFKLAQSSNISSEKFEMEKALLFDLRNAKTISEKLDLNRRIDSLRDEMKCDDPQFFSFLYEIPEFELEDIQRTLKAKTSIIEYFYTEENITAFQITKDTVQAKQTPIIENLDSLIREFKQVLVRPHANIDSIAKYDRILTEDGLKIYDLLLKSFEDDLIQNLIIIPDGPLFDLPFGVLPTSKHQIKRQNYGSVSYLIKNHNLSYANSIRTLLNQMEYNVQTDKNYIGIAPIDFSKYPNLDNLEQTEAEVKNGQRIFGGDILMRYKAKLDEFQKYIKMHNYNIIHFATHASSFDPKTNLPTIYFSDLRYDLNQIYASEINANLVVLSVCEAGNGEQVAGEGVLSIARGLAYNGVPSILTSLSKVGEESSAFLMNKFYENINAGERKNVALRKAKLKIINGELNDRDSSARPCYWGSFVVVGDTEPIFETKDDKNFPYYIGVLLFILFFGVFYRNKFFGRAKSKRTLVQVNT